MCIRDSVGAALIALLVWVELHADQPMIDFRLLRNRLFGVANLASLFASGGFLGLLFIAPIWLQTGRGFSALVSGSSTAPEAVSYTHLDVYKRQVLRPVGQSPMWFAGTAPILPAW